MVTTEVMQRNKVFRAEESNAHAFMFIQLANINYTVCDSFDQCT